MCTGERPSQPAFLHETLTGSVNSCGSLIRAFTVGLVISSPWLIRSPLVPHTQPPVVQTARLNRAGLAGARVLMCIALAQVWVCVHGHACGNGTSSFFCFAFDEVRGFIR